MTESEFLALEPREQAALVATKVMGLEFREWKPYYSGEGWYPVDFQGATVGEDREPRGYSLDLPVYTYDIADAWQVVEKMHDAPDHEWAEFEDGLLSPVGGQPFFYLDAAEAALHIATTALKTKGEIDG